MRATMTAGHQSRSLQSDVMGMWCDTCSPFSEQLSIPRASRRQLPRQISVSNFLPDRNVVSEIGWSFGMQEKSMSPVFVDHHTANLPEYQQVWHEKTAKTRTAHKP